MLSAFFVHHVHSEYMYLIDVVMQISIIVSFLSYAFPLDKHRFTCMCSSFLWL